MKLKYAIPLLVGLSLSGTAFSQGRPGGWDFSAGLGMIPLDYVDYQSVYFNRTNGNTLSEQYSPSLVDCETMPWLEVRAWKRVRSWLSVGGRAGTTWVGGAYLDPMTDASYPLKGFIISLQPAAHFDYYTGRIGRLYGDAGVGLLLRWQSQFEESSVKVKPVFEIVPVGAAIGRKVYFFEELVLGTAISGMRAGLGLKF